MSANNIFRIAIGDYDFAVDRQSRNIYLRETKTDTVWADFDIPSGWIELQSRETGIVERHDFSAAKLVTLSEKAGADGKRILFGLDLFGIPIDLYYTCAPREIQLTVEASRDSRTHTVQNIGLLPGLCRVPADSSSYIVLPDHEGKLYIPNNGSHFYSHISPLWSSSWTMPFWGAVRIGENRQSALGLITDSAYAVLSIQKAMGSDVATADVVYCADSERRRLDMRIVLIPNGDYVAIARAYREKLVGQREHILLRRKIRENPEVENLIGGALISLGNVTNIETILTDLKEECGIDRAVCLVPAKENNADNVGIAAIRAAGYSVGWRGGKNLSNSEDADTLFAESLGKPLSDTPSRWDDLQTRTETMQQSKATTPIVGTRLGGDWSAIASDFWLVNRPGVDSPSLIKPVPPPLQNLLPDGFRSATVKVPLLSVVYHDSVVVYPNPPLDYTFPHRFLRALLTLSPPHYAIAGAYCWKLDDKLRDYIRTSAAILLPLHRESFPAFLQSHRFLTEDFLVEEAVYTNNLRIVINQSENDSYMDNDLNIEPLGWRIERLAR